ncbi:MAG: zf-TFIIB domain-containing protein [Mesorhizobium sp.]|nr:zf-TFIIB domain-containing protein [Mesorhizobium sp.]MBL8577290.1 zf-TFIIB domain-containing protein [Mesorhizobium sp.]
MSNTIPRVGNHSNSRLLCPACQVDLVMSDRQGIEIDYCPQCRGVWLDRGELDKIIERSVAPGFRDAGQDRSDHSQGYDQHSARSGRDGHGYGEGRGNQRGHGRGSFLSRLFD